jgi:hypothetical protein
MRIMSNQEIRRMLEMAFHEGRVRGKWESSPPFNEFGGYDREPLTFDEWYRKNYE